MGTNLDIIDRKILYELDRNARTTAVDISMLIKKPKETVNYRIRKLCESKIINKFYTIINSSRVGYNYYFIFLKLQEASPMDELAIIEFIRKDTHCVNLRKIEGQFDFSFIVTFKNNHEFSSFFARFHEEFGEKIYLKSAHILLNTHKLSKRFLFEGPSAPVVIDQSISYQQELDPIEADIIDMICENARIKTTTLAENLNTHPKVIAYHLKKLEKSQIIRGYFTSLNYDLLERQIIQINICLRNPKFKKNIIEFFDRTGLCIFAYELIGKYDLTVELSIDYEQALKEIVSEFKKSFCTNFIYYDIFRVYDEYIINWSPFKV